MTFYSNDFDKKTLLEYYNKMLARNDTAADDSFLWASIMLRGLRAGLSFDQASARAYRWTNYANL